jgi:hypothetical protein
MGRQKADRPQIRVKQQINHSARFPPREAQIMQVLTPNFGTHKHGIAIVTVGAHHRCPAYGRHPRGLGEEIELAALGFSAKPHMDLLQCNHISSQIIDDVCHTLQILLSVAPDSLVDIIAGHPQHGFAGT